MPLSQDKHKDHLYIFQVRLNYNKHAATIDALKALIALSEKSTPEGEDSARPVLMEFVDVYNGAERKAIIGSPLDMMENRINSKLLGLLDMMDDGFSEMLRGIEGMELVTNPESFGAVTNGGDDMPIGDDIMAALIGDHANRSGSNDE